MRSDSSHARSAQPTLREPTAIVTKTVFYITCPGQHCQCAQMSMQFTGLSGTSLNAGS
jgi:hypothetical protein